MRIVVNDVAASNGGALSILRSFYSYISENDHENEYIFLLSGKYIKETKNIKVIILDKNWFNRFKFDIINGKKVISSLNPDIVFSLQNTLTHGIKCSQIIYMHQSIPFQKEKKFSFWKGKERKLAVYQYIIGVLIKISIKKADAVIVQTDWIKQSVIESTNSTSEKIIKIAPNINKLYDYKTNDVFNKKNFFYPAADLMYKNHECIYKANELLLSKGFNIHNIELTLKNKSENSNIINIGEIRFEDVMKKYNKSTLIFPSYIETAGLPLIEARQLGTIILASNCLFSKEALNGYENAYFFDPFAPEELATLMEKVISGEIKKEKTTENLYNEENSWSKVLDILVNTSDTTL